ncbi:MAG: DNA polymerase I [Roseiflexaceae bacterium]
MTARLLLIDGHALAFRAFYALADTGMRTSTGEATFAVYGFVSIMLNAIREHNPTHIAVSFDIGRTFRDDLYAEYKAGRAETPQEFHSQLERIKEMMHAFNIPIYVAAGFEADDVLGTLSCQATALGVETYILTGDSDTLQLVNTHVRVVLANPYGQRMSSIVYDTAKVIERYEGLHPHQLIDLRGLKGDTSDNIPGVKGIGEKGAITLLNQFGSIEGIFTNLEHVPNRYKKILAEQRDAAEFSRRLATIVLDVPVTLELTDCDINHYDKQTVIRFFQSLEFGQSLIVRLPTSVNSPPLVPIPILPGTQITVQANQQLDMFGGGIAMPQQSLKHGYAMVCDEALLREVAERCRTRGAFAFDCETTGTRVFQDRCIGISLACAAHEAWYIPLHHSGIDTLAESIIVAVLGPIFADATIAKYTHNAKFDIEVLAGVGINVQHVVFDSMLAASLLDKRRSLKELAFYELQLPEVPTTIDQLIGKGKQQITLDHADIHAVTNYAASDADYTWQLGQQLQPQIMQAQGVADVFTRLEMPLIAVLVRMEQAGICVDAVYLRELSQRVTARIIALESEIFAIAGSSFNIASSDQLSDILFGKLGLPTQGLETTKTGRYSLTAEVLEKLRGNDQSLIIERILQHRQLSKLKSTYIDALPELINPKTGRVHTSYNQLGAATGRLSSVEPNLQNIPTRTEEGREVRRAFVAAPGHVLVAADYSQIELRVLAHITEDPNLLQAFHEDQDIHAATAAQLFGIERDQVDKNQRRIAKTTVFGVIYGISAFGLAQRTNLSRTEAQALIDGLFARFPRVKEYIEATKAHARATGYVTSLFGRRRAIPEINIKGPRQQAAEREAINHPIQATAADIMKLAMLRVDAAITAHDHGVRMLLQVHDELIIEAPINQRDAAAALLRTEMSAAYPELRVPLKVDVEAGIRWDALEAL